MHICWLWWSKMRLHNKNTTVNINNWNTTINNIMMLDTMMQDTIDLHQGAEYQRSHECLVCQGLLCVISWSVESCRRESVFPTECTLLYYKTFTCVDKRWDCYNVVDPLNRMSGSSFIPWALWPGMIIDKISAFIFLHHFFHPLLLLLHLLIVVLPNFVVLYATWDVTENQLLADVNIPVKRMELNWAKTDF